MSLFADIENEEYGITLTREPADVARAVAFRQRIFNTSYEIETDIYDAICDHLIVYRKSDNEIIGNYRMLTAENLDGNKFYTEGEFDISELLQNPENICEVGRSCVDESVRNGAVITMLWKGLARYLEIKNKNILFGCASFKGTDINKHLTGISYLRNNHLDTRIKSLQSHSINYTANDNLDIKRAFVSLPPLIKGYLRVGARVSDGVFVDTDYNTVDVAIIVDSLNAPQKYKDKFIAGE
jgi:L-ornithine Nalpha-acyltransferase